MSPLTIGALARAACCKVQTIRYYEEIGLLPNPVRSAGNQRHYHPRDIVRLSFIRHCRGLGFSLDAIRELLNQADEPSRACAAVDAIARTHLCRVEDQIARLLTLKEELQRIISQCQGGRIANCRIIESLACPPHGRTHSDAADAQAEGTPNGGDSDAPEPAASEYTARGNAHTYRSGTNQLG